MTFRSPGRKFMSCGRKSMSCGPRAVGLHETSSDYFDFVTYFAIISLSMGMCEYEPFKIDDSARGRNTPLG
jgi:hypothetical protein